MQMGVIVVNLFMIFLLIAVGFLAGRMKWVALEAQKYFTSFMINISLPSTIFTSMIREWDPALVRDSIIIFVLGFVLIGGNLFLQPKLAKLFCVAENHQSVWAFAAAQSNIGFMGFPLVLAVLGSDALFLAAMINMASTILCWTLGVRVMSQGKDKSVDWKKILKMNTNFAIAAGMIFFIFQIPVPGPIFRALEMFSNTTTPLSMFLIGLSLAGGSVISVFREKDVLTLTLMRLVIAPFVCIVILKLLPLPGQLLLPVAAMVLAMPSPAVTLTQAVQFGQDEDFASKTVFFTSFCSIFTIPLMMMIL